MSEKLMTFGQAIEALKAGKKVSRKGWNGKGMYIQLQVPDEHSKMTSPYLYVESRFGCVPWKETFVEMFNNSWEVVE